MEEKYKRRWDTGVHELTIAVGEVACEAARSFHCCEHTELLLCDALGTVVYANGGHWLQLYAFLDLK